MATLAKVAWCSHSWAWQWCLERDGVWNWWKSPRNTNGLESDSLKEPNGNDWCTAFTVDLKDSDRITQFPSGLMTRLPYTVSCTSISRRELRDTKQLTARRNWAAAAENRIPSTRGLSTGGGDHVTHIIIRFHWLRNRRFLKNITADLPLLFLWLSFHLQSARMFIFQNMNCLLAMTNKIVWF